MANANDIRARHYLIHLDVPETAWLNKTIIGQVIIFLEPIVGMEDVKGIRSEKFNDNTCESSYESIPLNDKTSDQETDLILNTDFECILDCCDLIFDSVQEVVLPNSYYERFYGPQFRMLTFEERKHVEVMRNFFR